MISLIESCMSKVARFLFDNYLTREKQMKKIRTQTTSTSEIEKLYIHYCTAKINDSKNPPREWNGAAYEG